MKAVKIQAFGGPEQLTVHNLPTPSAGPGQVLIAVEAVGVGLADVLLRQGRYPGLSAPGMIPGGEVTGTVTAVGEGVDSAWLGRRVFAFLEGMGGYAEQVVADAAAVVKVPAAVTAAAAVALGVNALVAKFTLERAGVRAGDRVLIRGAAGGIGVMATQLAARAGATVFVTTSARERGQRLVNLGASRVLDRAATPTEDVPEDFDVIIDPVAGPEIAAFLGKLRPNGRLVLCGAAGGFPTPDFGTALLAGVQKSLTFATFSLNTVDAPSRAAALEEVFGLLTAGHVQPVIHEVFALESAPNAHASLEAGEVFGKVVLTPEHVSPA